MAVRPALIFAFFAAFGGRAQVAAAQTPPDSEPKATPTPDPYSSGVVQEAPPPPPELEYRGHLPPPARVGFQAALRGGLAVAMGDTFGGPRGEMKERFGGQGSFVLELGAKVTPMLFVGVYGGLQTGSVSGMVDEQCTRARADCSIFGQRLGAEVQLHLTPDRRGNVWIGYGFGYENIGLSATRGPESTDQSLSGLEYAHLMAGVDLRIEERLGIGPFIDLAIGEYSSQRIAATGTTTIEQDLPLRATHQWLTIGARLVAMP